MRFLIMVLFFQVFLSQKTIAQQHKKQPNIVWITSEDNSKHYMKMFDEHGVETPNIEKLAKNGLTYTHAFSNTPVCSAARSTLISGCYGPKLASHYHRRIEKVPMPNGIKMYPAYLKQAGYYTVNNAKEDYNIYQDKNVWDVSSRKGTWRNREKGQPFFYIHNLGISHEGQVHASLEKMKKEVNLTPENSFVFPNHPNTELFKYTNAFYRHKIQLMDKQVGEIVAELKKDKLLEDTFIFYYGDHGGVLPGSKGYLYESGLHVPLVVYVPENYEHLVNFKKGTEVTGFVNFIDIGVTALNLAGIESPKGIDGKAFLGNDINAKEINKRDESYSYADRFDEKYDMVRAIRKGNFKYIRNYQPFNVDGLMNRYRYKQKAYVEWKEMHAKGELNNIQSQFFEKKAPEALYDLSVDPYETKNLAKQPKYAKKLKQLRKRLCDIEMSMPDLSFYPEFHLIENAFENPVNFGEKHKKEIKKYLKIADLPLYNYEKVKSKIRTSLLSKDPWERYWGLIVCSSFGEIAKDQLRIIQVISTSDSELINRVRAAEYMGLIKEQNPIKIMSDCLYKSKRIGEIVLILNSITLMEEFSEKYNFTIDISKLDSVLTNNKIIKSRITYLKQ